MTHDQIIDIAVQEGFSSASVIDTSVIVFDASFRSYCMENLCGQYGANHSCPPLCGTPEEMKQRILKYKNTLVMQTVWNIPDCRNNASVESAKKNHRDYSFKVIERLKQHGIHGLLVGASFCSLCTPCSISEGKPCTLPEKQYSCMSAYCIHVKALAEKCGMVYDYRDGLLPLFSLFAFD
jgi:predicted metal-binding protein